MVRPSTDKATPTTVQVTQRSEPVLPQYKPQLCTFPLTTVPDMAEIIKAELTARITTTTTLVICTKTEKPNAWYWETKKFNVSFKIPWNWHHTIFAVESFNNEWASVSSPGDVFKQRQDILFKISLPYQGDHRPPNPREKVPPYLGHLE